ncbi:hypothetical protein GIB67_019051 [Kingdonia uniflora]|uniref:protein-serine/threonine phosphatase n=1 Tax=Kingdonia uniflora TaxID=39325 RepID=A0A7J7MZW2_9MAGN|nr:hypothetical protein GIB67_019051 [Kingdonia uniflora]
MAEICFFSMVGDEDTAAKCREIRRRKLEMRRFPPNPGDAEQDRNLKEKRGEAEDFLPTESKRTRMTSTSSEKKLDISEASFPSTSGQQSETDFTAIFGSLSVSGRSRAMEDAILVRPNLYKPKFNGSRPIHFLGVYDGHGGPHVNTWIVATLCKERMHVFLEEELARENITDDCPNDTWRSVLKRSFERMDEVALTACACGSIGGNSCGCERGGVKSDIVGSTAVVSVLTDDRILVANCGDSRAVLSRGGIAIPLSEDHKPDRPDELARIEAAGGRVIYLNGARVQGILAMSRALGDKYLKPIVISEPEMSITDRTPEDECLILASDGLWDVLSNDMACDVARRCLSEGSPPRVVGILDSNSAPPVETTKESSAGTDQVHQPQSRCSLAAALLTRLALGRKSNDNISVIVVDLKGGQMLE